MIKLLTIPGCSRARSIKQFANEMEVGIDEENVFRFLLDQEANASAIAAIADYYGRSADELLQNPSLISRPLVTVSKTLTDKEVDFLVALKQKEYFEQCLRKCTKRSVCPARQHKIDVLYLKTDA